MLFNRIIGPFIAKGSHEQTTLFPSMDCKNKRGKILDISDSRSEIPEKF
jgi:hypothetical protein